MDRCHASGHHSPSVRNIACSNLIVGNDIPVTNCFALLAPLGAHPVASEPAANEQGLKFSRVQGALR
jgi:hypothetical protein